MVTKFFDATLVRTPDQAVEFVGSILESSTEHSIIGQDFDGNIQLWNAGACRMYGHEPEEVIGRATSSILYGEEALAANLPQQMTEAALQTGHWSGTAVSRRKDGSEFTARLVLTPRRNAAGKPVGFLLMSKDLPSDDSNTDLREAKPFDSSIVGTMDLARVVSQFALQQAALETAAGIMITDDHGVLRWVNAAFTTTTGFTAEEAIGKTPAILKSGKHTAEFYAQFWSTIRRGLTWTGEFINRRKDGSIYYDQHIVTPVRGLDGQITHFVGIMHDVTKRREAEASLLEAHQEMSDLLMHSPAVLYALTIDGKSIEPRMVSENVTRLLGFSVSETLSRAWWQGQIHPDDLGRAEASLVETVENGSSQTEYRLRHRDGSYRWVEDNRRLVEGAGGSPAGMAGVWADITRRKKAEEESLESERRFRDMLDHLELVSVILDVTGRVAYCNDYFLKLTGWGRDEVIGRDWIEHFALPEEAVELRKNFGRMITDGGAVPRHYRVVLLTRSGERRLIQWNTSILRSPSGAVIGVATIGEDVTNRVLAERAIIENEERLRIIIDASTDAMWEWNLADDTAAWSDRAYAMLGYERATFEPTLQTIREIIHPDDIALFERSVAEHLEAGAPFQMRLRLRHADGFYVPVLARGQLRRERAQMVGVFTDLSALERAEAHIREQAALIDQARDAIVVRDLEDRVTFWSKGAERLYGIAAPDAIGKRFGDLLQIEPGTSEAAKQVVVTKGAWNGEIEMTTAAGAAITLDCRWTLLANNGHASRRILSIDTDITEKKSLEQQFFRAQRLEGLGTLAAGIAHDLNNLLMPILMGVTLLKRMDPSEKSLRAIGNIEKSARRGADLVKQVLLFARGVEGSRTSLDVRAVIGEVEAILASTFPKNITFETRVPETMGRVLGDSTQVNQVLLNLCVNARDAMPRGGQLTITAEERDVDLHTASMHGGAIAGHYVVIVVSDTGSGMSPEVLDHVFEPFFTTKEQSKGTGLGLSTARGIVRSHGGFIDVSSKAGRGSSFCVYLPAQTTRTVSDAIEAEVEDLTHGHGEIILVVDDELPILDITRQALASFDYEVITSDKGTEALAIYERQHQQIAAVITDLMMPTMDGHVLIAALRAIDRKVPIIAMSGHIDASTVPEATKAGATTVLSKPLSTGLLLRTLSRVLKDSPGRSKSAGASGKRTPVAAPTVDHKG